MIARTEVDILETKGKLVRRILEITDGDPNGPDIVTDLLKNRIELEKLKLSEKINSLKFIDI